MIISVCFCLGAVTGACASEGIQLSKTILTTIIFIMVIATLITVTLKIVT